MPLITEQAPLAPAALGAFEPLRMPVALQPEQADAVIQEFGHWNVNHAPLIPRSARWLHMSRLGKKSRALATNAEAFGAQCPMTELDAPDAKRAGAGTIGEACLCDHTLAKLVRASWVCAILDNCGLWNHLRGITGRETSVTL
jgi:hypothetical protein